MKKIKVWKHEKEFDTQTIVTDLTIPSEDLKDTKETVDRKTLAESEIKITIGQKTQKYEPRPLTPDDDIYEDIIEQFASAPTKPKYWFEEFGDYWSCSCGHINKGDRCKSCGLERDLLRSLFILHKPADAPGKLDKKLKRAKGQADQEAERQEAQENRRREREAAGEDMTKVVPIETDRSEHLPAAPASKPAKSIQYKEISVAELAQSDQSKKKKISSKMIIAIVVCLLLVGACGAAIYTHIASPAILYEEAQELQANGQYEKAIEKYEALGDYKDSAALIWECYVAMADDYFANGKYQKAIETYQIAKELDVAVDMKNGIDLDEKIRSCYIAIGDKQTSNGEYIKALDTYAIAAEMKNSDDLQDKINACKFAYVQTYQADRTAQVEQYMTELMSLKYPGIQELYDAYYAWHIKIIANTSESDFTNDRSTFSRKDTIYFHALISGGEPNEVIEMYYEVTWPNGSTQIYSLDSKWQNGSKITARFQYPIPLFGAEGKLTFTLYDKNTKEVMGTDSVTFQN